jgi:glycosyltransferase involved in cell wall biosynthesis
MDLPKVSFIIPTLNSAGVLPGCLAAIRRQDYPKELIEIVIPDGGSTDATREIAKSFGAIVIENPDRVAESGKRTALERIKGEIVVFVDSDNELTHADFVRLQWRA